MALDDFMKNVVCGIEAGDHRVIEINAGEEVPDAMIAWMEADGYEFAVSPRAPKGTKRKVFFTRRRPPELRM